MKVIFYLLTTLFGLFGVLSLLRFAEVLVFGGRLFPVQVMFGAGGLILAWLCLNKARSK